jgi:hypothetical protein
MIRISSQGSLPDSGIVAVRPGSPNYPSLDLLYQVDATDRDRCGLKNS